MQPVGEHLVDPQIAGHVAAGEFRQIEPVMQDRPQHPVGEAVVDTPGNRRARYRW